MLMTSDMTVMPGLPVCTNKGTAETKLFIPYWL